MDLVIDRQGNARCLYTEVIDLAQLGELVIQRASHVEPDKLGRWWADLSPVGGPKLGPFTLRSEALAAEVAWLERHHFPQSHAVTGASRAGDGSINPDFFPPGLSGPAQPLQEMINDFQP